MHAAQLHGSFRVVGRRVVDLHGVTQRQANFGCPAGMTVTVVGKAPIVHIVLIPTADDYWVVGSRTPAGDPFARVRLALRLRGSRKVIHTTGWLRMFFPGGTAEMGGYTDASDINFSYGPSAAQVCNLNFSIRRGA